MRKILLGILICAIPSKQIYSQSSLDVATLGVGLAAMLIGSALAEEEIAEQLEEFAVDHLLETDIQGTFQLVLVQRQFNNKNGKANSTAYTFLVTQFNPNTQQIIDKQILLLLIRNRVSNEFGMSSKPYIWIEMNSQEWRSLVSSSITTFGPSLIKGNKTFIYDKINSNETPDISISNLDSKLDLGRLSETSLDMRILTDRLDKINREMLKYDLGGDSYVVKDLTLDGEKIKLFVNEDRVGIYSTSLDSHSILKLKDLIYLNAFMAN